MKHAGTWDPAYVEVIKDVGVDGVVTHRRTDLGRKFAADMGKAWADIRDTIEGQRVREEAHQNYLKRSALRSTLQTMHENQVCEGQVSQRTLSFGLGIGNSTVPVEAEAYRHLKKHVHGKEAEFVQLHDIIPAQPKTDAKPSKLSCADVGFCVDKCKVDHLHGGKTCGPLNLLPRQVYNP